MSAVAIVLIFLVACFVLGVIGVVRAMWLRKRGRRFGFTLTSSIGCLVVGIVLLSVLPGRLR